MDYYALGLLGIFVVYHGFKEYLWQKERACLIRTFESEKREVARHFSNKESDLDKKGNETVKVFMEEVQKINTKYVEEMAKFGRAASPDVPFTDGALADALLAIKEKEDMDKIFSEHPELNFTGKREHGGN